MNSGFGNIKDIPFGLCKRTYKDIENSLPVVEFIDDISAFFESQPEANVEAVLTVLKTLLEKFKYYEKHLIDRKEGIKSKRPETLKNIEHLNLLLNAKEPTNLDILLSDNVFVSCEIPHSEEKEDKTVGLWLGANVMVEYTYSDALEMLQTNLATIQTRLSDLDTELAFVKTQITTSEVTIARIYNFDVKSRRQAN